MSEMQIPVPPHTELGAMSRDDRDEWPKDEPVGSFDIEPFNCPSEYPTATAHILFVCPNGRRCGVLLGPVSTPRPSEDKCHVWGWDGNVERSTITPSINCIAEKDGKPTGGCGWHGFITNGVMR